MKQTKIKVKHDAGLQDYIIMATGKSRTAVKSLFAHKQVFVDGKNISQYDFQVKQNQLITINSVGTSQTEIIENQLKILFEDENIIVIDKPAGILSISTGNANEITAYSILRNHVKMNSSLNKIFIVHRLDKDTSGVMLFAKTENAKTILQTNWDKIVVQRKYVAVVEGKMQTDTQTLVSYLKENAAMQMYVSKDIENAKRAVLTYKVLKTNNKYSLIEIELETGRKNQIRVQMQEAGHSIAGDKKYGGKPSPIGRMALHAKTLEFIHPITRKMMCFTTKIPKKFINYTNCYRL
jgi:23S rRNA pseudouridine1911/1915/1917 synthase